MSKTIAPITVTAPAPAPVGAHAPIGGFVPAINKSGKVTATAEKIAQQLNQLSEAGIKGVALDGKGAMGKAAIAHLTRGALTIEAIVAMPEVHPAQWGEVLAVLTSVYGVADYNRATMRGREGCATYLGAVRRSLEQRFDRAETAKQQENAQRALVAFAGVETGVLRLINRAREAVAALQAAKTATPA